MNIQDYEDVHEKSGSAQRDSTLLGSFAVDFNTSSTKLA